VINAAAHPLVSNNRAPELFLCVLQVVVKYKLFHGAFLLSTAHKAKPPSPPPYNTHPQSALAPPPIAFGGGPQ
jgi:hypothetical protein